MSNEEYRGRERRADHGVLQKVLEEFSDKLDAMNDKIDKRDAQIEGMISAWNTGKGLVAFVKWFASVILAAGVIWGAFFKGKWP